jgi:hypothetical protein
MTAANAAMQQQLHHALHTGTHSGTNYSNEDIRTNSTTTTTGPGGPVDPFNQ